MTVQGFWLATKRLCHGRFPYWPTDGPIQELAAHQLQVLLSLIHTAELNDVAPFDYLVALQRNAAALAANPTAWMPWNYQAALTSRKRVAAAHYGAPVCML